METNKTELENNIMELKAKFNFYHLEDIDERTLISELEEGISLEEVSNHMLQLSHDNIETRLETIEEALRDNGLTY